MSRYAVYYRVYSLTNLSALKMSQGNSKGELEYAQSRNAKNSAANEPLFKTLPVDQSLVKDGKLLRHMGKGVQEGYVDMDTLPTKVVYMNLYTKSLAERAYAVMAEIQDACLSSDKKRWHEYDHLGKKLADAKFAMDSLFRISFENHASLPDLVRSIAADLNAPFSHRVEFIAYQLPEKPEPQVYIGVNGMHFRSECFGPDAPVNDTWGGLVFMVVDLSLCPAELQAALGYEPADLS